MVPDDDLLGADLRDLGRRLDVPPPPDVRAAVRARLAGPTVARAGFGFPRLGWRRWLAAGVAALTCVVVAVPPARAAVGDAVGGLLRFAGIEVDARPRALPPSPDPLPSARTAELDEARRLARFPVLVPVLLGAPERVTVADPGPDGAPRVVSLVYRGGTVRLDQFDGRLQPHFYKTADAVDWVQVGAETALWFDRPHPVSYVDRSGTDQSATARLAGPTLIWQRDAVTYRLEGVASVAEAIGLAESLR